MSVSKGQSKILKLFSLQPLQNVVKIVGKKAQQNCSSGYIQLLRNFLDNLQFWLFNISVIVFRYYFPTYENDTLLCTLSDSESDLTAQEQNGNIAIISEDTSKLRALKQSSILNQLLLHESLKNQKKLPQKQRFMFSPMRQT